MGFQQGRQFVDVSNDRIRLAGFYRFGRINILGRFQNRPHASLAGPDYIADRVVANMDNFIRQAAGLGEQITEMGGMRLDAANGG